MLDANRALFAYHNTMTRSAAIFLGEDRIVIQPDDRAVSGFGVASPYVRCLSHAATVQEILVAVDESLTACRIGVPDPDPRDRKSAAIQQLLAATGEKTWHAVSRSFAYVGVTDSGKSLEFFTGFPEKGAFLFRKEAHWSCKHSKGSGVVAAFRAAAVAAIDAQSLRNPPSLT
jgi:hypothetical protein